MAILSKGINFSTGEQVTADKLDALVDDAAFVSGAVDGSSTVLSGGAIIVKDSGITASKIASNAVTTIKITDANVTTAKIADLNVTTDKIADLGVTTGKIADLNVTTGKIADLGVTTGKIADAAITTAKLAQPLTVGTAQNSTSGTSIDFNSIPSWAKRITVIFNGVSTNGTDNYLVQLTDSGGVETTGYLSNANDYGGTTGIVTNGFVLTRSGVIAAGVMHGTVVFIKAFSGDTWVSSGTVTCNGLVGNSAGTKTLSGTLTGLRITTVLGTNTFDAGQINIMYE